MALDIVGYINTNTSANGATKTRFLDGVAGAWGYKSTLEDGSSNPETKKDFVNRRIVEYLQTKVKNYEHELQQKAIVVSDISL